jgi:hypothetical protein
MAGRHDKSRPRCLFLAAVGVPRAPLQIFAHASVSAGEGKSNHE